MGGGGPEGGEGLGEARLGLPGGALGLRQRPLQRPALRAQGRHLALLPEARVQRLHHLRVRVRHLLQQRVRLRPAVRHRVPRPHVPPPRPAPPSRPRARQRPHRLQPSAKICSSATPGKISFSPRPNLGPERGVGGPDRRGGVLEAPESPIVRERAPRPRLDDPRRGDWTHRRGRCPAGGPTQRSIFFLPMGRRHGLAGGEHGRGVRGRYWKGQDRCLDLCADL